jgi:hypothetical protein
MPIQLDRATSPNTARRTGSRYGRLNSRSSSATACSNVLAKAPALQVRDRADRFWTGLEIELRIASVRRRGGSPALSGSGRGSRLRKPATAAALADPALVVSSFFLQKAAVATGHGGRVRGA